MTYSMVWYLLHYYFMSFRRNLVIFGRLVRRRPPRQIRLASPWQMGNRTLKSNTACFNQNFFLCQALSAAASSLKSTRVAWKQSARPREASNCPDQAMFGAPNFSLAMLMVVGTMTSCQAFLSPGMSGSEFNRAIGSLFNGEDSELSPEASPPIAPDEQASSADTSFFMGVDQDYVPFPHRDFSAPDVVHLCMDNLKRNNEPYANAGLECCFNFSTDRCRAAQGGSLEKFVQYAANPVFASMVNSKEWQVLSTGPLIQGTPTRGAMQTVLIHVQPRQGEARRFLWTLQKERRPPRQDCWLVWECLSVEHAYSHTL